MVRFLTVRRARCSQGRGSQGFSRAVAVVFALVLGLGAALGGCSAGLSEQSQVDRAISLMNQRRYEEAAVILEERLARERDPQIAWWLAHAHLGMGGFELFGFAAEVLGEQELSAGPVELAVDEPQCAAGKIEKLAGYDARCFTLRLLKYLPEAEEKHFRRARDIFREYFPREARAPLEVNFLSAIVELGSSVSRLRSVLRTEVVETNTQSAAEEDERFAYNVRHLKSFFDELTRGFRRASWSYHKVSDFVVTLDGSPLVRVGRAKLLFTEKLGFPAILEFAGEVLREEGGAVDAELGRAAEGYLGALPPLLVRSFELLDREHLGSATLGALRNVWTFEAALRRILAQAANLTESEVRFNFFELIWENPPALARGLSRAVHAAWQSESPQPIRDFYLETQDEWSGLEELARRWRAWFGGTLDGHQVRAIERHLVGVVRANPELFTVPVRLSGEEGRIWFRGLMGALRGGVQSVLSGGLPETGVLRPEQAAEGQRLLDESVRWFETNLWAIP